MEIKFYICKECGDVVTSVKGTPIKVSGCDKGLKELVPNTVDAATEKHIPIYKVDGNKVEVCVGEVEHPMQEAHSIEWILIQTTSGTQTKLLKPEEKPVATFVLADSEELEAVYAYCNLHGLWKA